MAYRVGVIPAAGKAKRFGGVLKECLPLPGGTLIELAISRLPVDTVLVVTRPDKIAQHAEVLQDRAIYLVQNGNNDIWSAIESALRIAADYYYFTMPDTVMPENAFYIAPQYADFALGTFETDMPERFGVLQDGKVINKEKGLNVPAKAWGVIIWSRKVRDFWLQSEIKDYTHAINLAIMAFGLDTWPLAYYHDISCMSDYMGLICPK